MKKKLVAVAQALCATAVLQAGVLALRVRTHDAPTPLLEESEARIREVAVHYAPGLDFADAVYRDFFGHLPADARVYVVVEKREHAEAFERLTGRAAVPVVVGRPITSWIRDRFAAAEERVLIVPPEPHRGGVARRNDFLAPPALAGVSGGRTRTAPFRFEGGDVSVAGGKVLLTSTWAARNPEREIGGLLREAERVFGRPTVYLPDAPDHHIGMLLAPIGGNRVLVGDLRWGRRLAPAGLDADDGEETALQFDAAAARLREAGFEVERIPVLTTNRDYVWISYTNAILEPGVVYMPVYGFADLDEAAAAVYARLGFEVRRVDASGAYPHGGALRCLVHVMVREG